MTGAQRIKSYKPHWRKVESEGNEGIKKGRIQEIK